MKIGTIGAGAVALAVAKSALAQGHEILLASRRGPASLSEAVDRLGKGATAVDLTTAAKAPLVLLAVPWNNVEEALAGLPAWEGRILVDATNPFTQVHPELVLADLGGASASELVARHAPDARVVKAFNSITMRNYEAGPRRGDAKRVLFVSGDDAAAKREVAALIESFGFATMDLGDLHHGGKLQQAGGPLAGKDALVGEGLPVETARPAELTVDEARSIVAPLYDALNRPAEKDIAALLAEACLPDYRSYSTNRDWLSRDQLSAQFQILAKIVPDLAWRIEDLSTSGDRIFVRGEATGTPVGDLFGAKPSGKSFRTMALDVFTVRDGKLASAYHVENWLAAMQQIG